MCWIIAATIITAIGLFAILFMLLAGATKPPPPSPRPLSPPSPPPPSPESTIDFYIPKTRPEEASVSKNRSGGSPTQCEPISKPMSSALPFANVPMAYACQKPI